MNTSPSTTNDNKVRACVDQSPFADAVADHAAWAARRLSTPLEFLHVIDEHPALGRVQDHSGAIGLDAQEQLLSQLAGDDAARNKAAREAGRLFLMGLRDRALQAGARTVDTRQRLGGLAETLGEQQADVRLFVLGRRGASASTSDSPQPSPAALGRQLEWVVRSLQRPVLAVPPQYREPSRVLFAFDGSAVTRQGIEMIARSPLLKGLPVHLLSAGEAPARLEKAQQSAQQTLQLAGFTVSTGQVAGAPAEVMAAAIRQQGFDLLVMGAFSHSPWRSWLRGSQTAELLRSASVPALLLR
jgi:nucleotide-binding universal stress UspA family protein